MIRSLQSHGVRAALSVLLLMLAVALLVPGEPATRPLSWDDLIAPLGVGLPVTRGYVLAPPRRGAGHDVVYVARRDPGAAGPAARVEVHILDRGRWSGVPETRSFSIGWEAPPVGSLVAGSSDDATAVRDALVAAIARNDTGFPSVDSIPLTSEPESPAIARILDRLSGLRGMLIGSAVALALVSLVSVPRGPIAVGLLLFALGFALRVASLDVPFAHDQDVQRLFTGGLPLRDIATGAGLEDRHPPLYFFILHCVQVFGQSEAVSRAPAVLAGALAGPALLIAVASMCGGVGPTAALAAFAVTVSPELIAQSRQVSEIPLFALMLIAAAASLVAALRAPRPLRLAAVALAHALALHTYYLAPFIIAAHTGVLVWLRQPRRRVVMAFATGVVAGIPALMLGGVTLVRDWNARDVARAFPALAWGEHAPLQMVAQMGRIAAETFGVPFLALMLVAIAVAAALSPTPRRTLAIIVPAVGAAATGAGIALLAPIARVQGYYVTTVLPLAALALAVVPDPQGRRARVAWLGALILAIALGSVPLLAGARALYIPDGDACMPRFASMIVQRPEATVVTVAHYDKTILAYYLARVEGRSIGWRTIDDPRTKRIETLVRVHAMDAESEAAAVRRLQQILAVGPALVIERDALLLPSIVQRLSTCELLLQAPTARLTRCASGDETQRHSGGKGLSEKR